MCRAGFMNIQHTLNIMELSMNGKDIKSAFDLRLLIQLSTIIITISVAWATMGNKISNHIMTDDVHMDYRELKSEFVTRETFDNEVKFMNEKLDRIEKLLINQK